MKYRTRSKGFGVVVFAMHHHQISALDVEQHERNRLIGLIADVMILNRFDQKHGVRSFCGEPADARDIEMRTFRTEQEF